MAHPHGTLAFLVAMASDKDHLSFAKQLLSGRVNALLECKGSLILSSRTD